MRSVFSRLTFANVMSLVAVFIALGGGAYAVTVAKNTVKSKSIKDGSIRGKDVGANALTGVNVDESTLTLPSPGSGPRGATGPSGATGPTGAAGSSIAYARLRADGTLETEGEGQTTPLPPQHKGVEQADIQKNAGAPAAESTGPGIYCFGGLDFTPTSATVTLDNSDSLPAPPAVTGGTTNFTTAVALSKGPDLGRCDAAHGQARVALTRVNDTAAPELADHGFFIQFEGVPTPAP